MTHQFSIALTFTLGLFACSARMDGQVQGRQVVENNVAGIETLEIERTSDGLNITALDEHGLQVGQLSLFVGEVTYTLEGDLEPTRTHGRSLTVQVAHDPEVVHVSGGEPPLNLPLTRAAMTSAFLDLNAVRAALGPFGIGFQEPERTSPGVETAYDYIGGDGPCESCPYDGCGASSTSSCGFNVYPNNNLNREWRCCSNGNFAERACEGPNQMTECGQAGGAGCAVCWQSQWSSFCEVFTTESGFCVATWE